MKVVFVLFLDVRHEGLELISVHRTMLGAEKARKKYVEKVGPEALYGELVIEKHEVQK